MTLGSLFDGSGGFPLAGLMCGIKPLWASEIEPYPIAVTRERLPFMQHLGSVLDLKGSEIPPVDVITFGSPCQDLSVAGKRAGIHDGARSNLFFEAIRVIREMREKTNGRYPTFILWENVPGAFSSNNGDDFRCVLEAIAQTADAGAAIPKPAKWQHAGEVLGDGYSIAWRMLDAQYWGVPQRRKRIYLVADFAGGRAEKILFERDGLQRDYQTRGNAGEDTAEDTERRVGKRDSGVLNAYGIDWRHKFPDMVKEKAPTQCGTDFKFPQGTIYSITAFNIHSIKPDNSGSGFSEETVCRTLQASGCDPSCNQGGNVICYSESAQYGQYGDDKPMVRASGGSYGGEVKR